MNKKLAEIFVLTSIFLSNSYGNNILIEDSDILPKEKPIPKGCKRYYYNKTGLCLKSVSEIYFDCLKPQKADEKYQHWLKLNRIDNEEPARTF